ncbi:hypothetical protein [Sneathiella litorea]|uniref:Uncharacterized protein n=1 Tax=Sneathiella litorea TaxID=2606216 RepID=A0A6L8WCB0_9PROT|nr:hypothetical protein [Sneathiella litorea]MZR32404.1 hypothetical protein [Sneathiella litorea]
MIRFLYSSINQLGRLSVKQILTSILLFVFSATQAPAMDFVIAGAPRSIVVDRNYEALFNLMRSNHIVGFFPTFQYQEIPEPKSFGFESDFLAPCSSNDASFKALRNADIKLVVPGELLYPDASILPLRNDRNDPLRQLIACVGRDNIYAVTNYDEAAYHGRPLVDVQRLYQQVKEVSADIPVLMVHGPLVMDMAQFSTSTKRARYLDNVVSFSQYADVVGFDVYPIPGIIAKLATPLSDGEIVASENTVDGYLQWMSENLPDKRKLMVFQGFAYSDMYEFEFLKSTVPLALRKIVRPPNSKELEDMVTAANQHGVEMIVWWGQAALRDASLAPWPDILKLARQFAD